MPLLIVICRIPKHHFSGLLLLIIKKLREANVMLLSDKTIGQIVQASEVNGCTRHLALHF